MFHLYMIREQQSFQNEPRYPRESDFPPRGIKELAHAVMQVIHWSQQASTFMYAKVGL